MARRLTLNWNEHHDALVSILQSLWSEDSLVDCTLAAEGKYLKAHKIILSACSPYFQLLFSQEQDKNPIVILKDVQYECLKSVMDFVYFGEVQVRESQITTFLEVARSLQIKGLDSNDKEYASKRQRTTRSKTKGSASQSMPCVTSDVINVESVCKVFQKVDRTVEISTLEQFHEPSPAQAEGVETITIESAYSMAPSAKATPTPGVDDSVNSEALEWPHGSVPQSVASSSRDSTDTVQSSETQEIYNLKHDPDENSIVREEDSTEPESGTGKNWGRSNGIYSSATEDGANKDGVTGGRYSDGNASGRKKRLQCSSSVSVKRSHLSQHVPRQSSLRLNPLRSEVATVHGKVTSSERTKKGVQTSSKEAVESSKETESTTRRRSRNKGDALSRVLSIVLDKVKVPASVLVPKKDSPSVSPSVLVPKKDSPSVSPSVLVPKKDSPSVSPSVLVPKKDSPSVSPSVLVPKKDPPSILTPKNDPPSVSPSVLAPKNDPSSVSPSVLVPKTDPPSVSPLVLVPKTDPPSVSPPAKSSKTSQRKRRYLKRHSCPECQKEFLRPSYLVIHRRKHTGEKPHLCPICNKCFAQPGALKRHSRVHTGERPYTCTYCHKSFNRSGILKIHMRLHTGERPYECPDCGKTFVAHSQLWSHKRVHMDGNYKCDACGESFKRKPLLAQHWFIVHENGEVIDTTESLGYLLGDI